MKRTSILLPVLFMLLLPCLSAAADTELQQKIDAAVNKIRQNPTDFSAWLEYRAQNKLKGTSEIKISKYEPIFIAVCNKNFNTMILAAVIMPGNDTGLYDVNAAGNNTPEKLMEIAEYIKTLDWFTMDGAKTRVKNPKIGGAGQISWAGCSGEIMATCPFIGVGDVDEVNHAWKSYYKKARKKNKGLSRLTWQFLSRNKYVWGIGYEFTEETMLPGQPIKREARIELVSKNSGGSCMVKLSGAEK